MDKEYDYNSIWIKWNALFNSEIYIQKNFIESIHIEVAKGFDIISKIATESIESHSPSFKKHINSIGELTALLTIKGYALYLISHNIDPEKKNLIASKETGELGNRWMENQEKDQGLTLMTRIDPILSVLLHHESKSTLDNFLSNNSEFDKTPYSEISIANLFFGWAIHQGYIFGILENE